jgi:prephenate dehydrogenase
MGHTVTFIGLGIIGGSIAKKIKQAYPQTKIIAISRTTETTEYALRNNIIDEAATSIPEAVRDADIVFVATPIEQIAASVAAAYKHSPAKAIIIDIGSTKLSLSKQLKKYRQKYIGGHPMFGSEKTGIQFSDPALAYEALFVLTPYKESPTQKLSTISEYLRRLDFRIFTTTPADHDAGVAAISHVPYLSAVALLRIAQTPASKMMAASGFKSCTRVGESDPAWGMDIAKTNTKEILRALSKLIKELQQIKSLIALRRFSSLKAYFMKSRSIRKGIYQ